MGKVNLVIVKDRGTVTNTVVESTLKDAELTIVILMSKEGSLSSITRHIARVRNILESNKFIGNNIIITTEESLINLESLKITMKNSLLYSRSISGAAMGASGSFIENKAVFYDMLGDKKTFSNFDIEKYDFSSMRDALDYFKILYRIIGMTCEKVIGDYILPIDRKYLGIAFKNSFKIYDDRIINIEEKIEIIAYINTILSDNFSIFNYVLFHDSESEVRSNNNECYIGIKSYHKYTELIVMTLIYNDKLTTHTLYFIELLNTLTVRTEKLLEFVKNHNTNDLKTLEHLSNTDIYYKLSKAFLFLETRKDDSNKYLFNFDAYPRSEQCSLTYTDIADGPLEIEEKDNDIFPSLKILNKFIPETNEVFKEYSVNMTECNDDKTILMNIRDSRYSIKNANTNWQIPRTYAVYGLYCSLVNCIANYIYRIEK